MAILFFFLKQGETLQADLKIKSSKILITSKCHRLCTADFRFAQTNQN